MKSPNEVNAPLPRLLFVDDDENQWVVMERLLARDFEVVIAASGAEGLKAIEEYGPFPVVLSDMEMPHMSGGEASPPCVSSQVFQCPVGNDVATIDRPAEATKTSEGVTSASGVEQASIGRDSPKTSSRSTLDTSPEMARTTSAAATTFLAWEKATSLAPPGRALEHRAVIADLPQGWSRPSRTAPQALHH